jgi:hypothetical protein
MAMRIQYIFLLALLAVPITIIVPSVVFASTGMSDCNNGEDEGSPDCGRQADRVGNDEEGDEDADRDGPGGEDDTPEEEDDDPNTPENDDANCWGKVTSDFTTTKDGDGGGDMSHASDPVRGDDDNETPREGVGNQPEGHPSDHADTVGPQFGSDEDCAQD